MSTNTDTGTTPPETESWEAKRDREKQENIDQRRALCNGVAAHLPGWHVTESDNEYLGYRFKLEDGTGHRVTLESSRTKGTWHVSGHWPQRTANGSYYVPSDVREESPSINVSTAKSHEQIARDISRRFLPEYVRIYALLTAKATEQNDYETRRAANWQRIAGSGYVKTWDASHLKEQGKIYIDGADDKTNFDAGYGDVNMESADSVKIELRSLPIDTALRVLEVLKKEWR
jgi:hypothetical protein